jgi:hypothetical protein
MEDNNNNGGKRKREVVKLYDAEKIPKYAKTVIKDDWNDLLVQDIPEDNNMAMFYVTKMYEECTVRLHKGIDIMQVSELEKMQKKINDIKLRMAGPGSQEFRMYNTQCESGLLCLSGTVFICVCALIQVLLEGLGSSFRVTQSQFEKSFEWAKKNKVITLDAKSHSEWTQMQVYIQLYTLCSRWTTLRSDNGLEPFWFASILEDKIATFITFRQSESVLDGSKGIWVRKIPSGKSEITVPSYEFIDDCSSMLFGMDRSLIIMDRIYSKFEQGEEDTALYWDLYYKWVQEKKTEHVIPDYLDDARENFVPYCTREGEVMKAMRKNAGVALKSMRWTLHATRCYQQIIWMMQKHTYDKDGKPKGLYPRRWQDHCMKLRVLSDILGSFDIKFFTQVYIQEANFWKIFEERMVMQNPFIVEVLGEQIVIAYGKFYASKNVESAMLIWILMMKKNKFMFISRNKTVDLSSAFDPLLTRWNNKFNKTLDDVLAELEDDMDIVL